MGKPWFHLEPGFFVSGSDGGTLTPNLAPAETGT